MGKILKIKESEAILEGAGVHLYRALDFSDTIEFDSFLLLDVFHSEDPYDYMAGFPWHPHRGI